MFRYLVRRLLTMIPMLFLISLVAFFLYSHQPGDQVYNYLPLDAPKADVERMRHVLGLDQPWYVQYEVWLSHAVKGDLGRSINDKQPVAQKFAEAIPVTLGVFGLGFVISFVLSIMIGVTAAVKRYSLFDYVSTIFVYLGQSMPPFWFALMLILLFTSNLHLLPVTGLHTPRQDPTLADTAKHLIMPMLVICWDSMAGWTRYVRSSMLEVLRLDYIRTARAKGISERVVLYKHALRNSLMPVITFLGFALSGILGGQALVEQIFSIPGMGRVTLSALFAKDYPVLMAAILLYPLLTMIGILLSDILYGIVDPRIRFS
ncbi:MAG: ABC transporter permease [Mycobacterium leprae]